MGQTGVGVLRDAGEVGSASVMCVALPGWRGGERALIESASAPDLHRLQRNPKWDARSLRSRLGLIEEGRCGRERHLRPRRRAERSLLRGIYGCTRMELNARYEDFQSLTRRV